MPVLIQIQTAAWTLEIVGPVRQPPPFLVLAADTRVDAPGATVNAHSRERNCLEPLAPNALIKPLLFENTDYDVYLATKQGRSTLHLPPTALARHSVGNIEHYALNFRNDVGFVEILIKNEVTGITKARLEIFPFKIDYRRDYVQLRDEVAAITRNLVMTAQARTFGAAAAGPAKEPTLVEWLALARGYFQELIKAANGIARNPHSRLVKEIENVPLRHAKKVDRRALDRLLRKTVQRVGATLPESGLALPERVPSATGHTTFDTPENRYIKALLLETRRNLQHLIRANDTGDEDANLNAERKFFDAIRPEARAMLRQVQSLLRASYLQPVNATAPTRPASLVFHHHAHYAAFARAALLLNGGLSLDTDLLQVGLKDIALLYEYWCFLKLVSLLAEQFDLVQQTFVRVKHTKITVTLAKGLEAMIKYRDRVTGKELLLIYNRFFNKLPTISQKPDNIIQLANDHNWYIFDAKYRLAYGPQYEKQFGGVGPTIEDINTMHRYRDAIVLPVPNRQGAYQTGVVRGAIVLFPCGETIKYQSHTFYESLASVDIGGLPFLPHATALVEEKLRSILSTNN